MKSKEIKSVLYAPELYDQIEEVLEGIKLMEDYSMDEFSWWRLEDFLSSNMNRLLRFRLFIPKNIVIVDYTDEENTIEHKSIPVWKHNLYLVIHYRQIKRIYRFLYYRIKIFKFLMKYFRRESIYNAFPEYIFKQMERLGFYDIRNFYQDMLY